MSIALLVQRCKRFETLVSVRGRVASEHTLDHNLDPEPSNDGETNSRVETLRLSIEFSRLEKIYFWTFKHTNKQAINKQIIYL